MNTVELIGYLAPIFIILSMMQSNIKKIRLLMIAGCVIFIVYGYLVDAWPVVIANGLIGVVTLYYLLKSQNVKREFKLIDVSEAADELLQRFINEHKNDLFKLYPNFSLEDPEGQTPVFFVHDLQPVGLFSYRQREQGKAELLIDYVAPAYRDAITEKYLYCSNEGLLKKKNIQEIYIENPSSEVQLELKQIGFVPSDKVPNRFEKTI